MIKQQLLQIGSADSFFNNHTSLYQFQSNQIFVQQYSGEFQINYQNRLVIKHLALSDQYLKFGDDKVINLTNVCMQKIVHPKFGLFGIKLSKNGVSLEIFGNLDPWIDIMKKFTIQFDFLQKYQLLNKIGEGYSTIVYRARNKTSRQDVACKVYDKKRLLMNNYEAKTFLKQLKILRLINHSNVIQFLETYESNNHIYIITECLKGEKLAHLIESQQKVSEEQVIAIMKPLFNAVQYLHEKNIFHKSLSLTNILLKNKQQFENPCIIDFNQSESLTKQDIEEQNILRGNLEKQIQYLTKFDILSLAITMHSLLTGNYYQTEKAVDDAMMNQFQGVSDLQLIDPPLSDQCFDFMNTLFTQSQKIQSCKQLLTHPVFEMECQKSQKNLGIQFLGAMNSSQTRFKISSKYSQRSPRAVKAIPVKKGFNIISKSPSEKPIISDYFEPPKSHLMFRRGSRQKRTLNFNNHTEISDQSID